MASKEVTADLINTIDTSRRPAPHTWSLRMEQALWEKIVKVSAEVDEAKGMAVGPAIAYETHLIGVHDKLLKRIRREERRKSNGL